MLRNQKSNLLFWGIVLCSISLHGVVLKFPLPKESSPDSLQVESLDSTELPALDIVSLPLPAASASNKEPIQDALSGEPSANDEAVLLSTIAASEPARSPVNQALVVPQNTPTLPVQDPASQQESVEPDEVAGDVQSQGNEESTSSIGPDSNSSDDNLSESNALESEGDVGAEHAMLVKLGDDFPDLAGAQSGCYGLTSCRQLSENYRTAARQLIEQMKSKGYQVTERQDIENTGHQVFEVVVPTEQNAVYYLNVFSSDIGSTVYVMTVDVMSLEELKQLSA